MHFSYGYTDDSPTEGVQNLGETHQSNLLQCVSRMGTDIETQTDVLNQMKALLENGADPNAQDEQGNTALHTILSESKIGEYIPASRGTESDHNPFKMEARVTDPKVIELYKEQIQLLIEYGADVDAINTEGVTPLLRATQSISHVMRIEKEEELPCTTYRSSLLQILLDNGADPNATFIVMPDGKYGEKLEVSVWNFSATYEHQDITDLLGNYGADLKYAAVKGIRENNAGLVEAALCAGFDLNKQDVQGNSLVHLACDMKPTEEVFDVLLEHGANPYQKNKAGLNGLMLFCSEKDFFTDERFPIEEKTGHWRSPEEVTFSNIKNKLISQQSVVLDMTLPQSKLPETPSRIRRL